MSLSYSIGLVLRLHFSSGLSIMRRFPAAVAPQVPARSPQAVGVFFRIKDSEQGHWHNLPMGEGLERIHLPDDRGVLVCLVITTFGLKQLPQRILM